jgi:ribosomal protein S18 acetylase RimI-like enzyme
MPSDQANPAQPSPHARAGLFGPPIRIPPGLRVSAAERLVSAPDRHRAARTLVETAAGHGIDLDLLWGNVRRDHRSEMVAQVCLAVPSAGRTAMLFLSSPGTDRRLGPPEQQQAQLTDVLRLALSELPGACRAPLGLAQTLIEPGHEWAEQACRDAGMTWVGRLHFMRLPWPVRFARTHGTEENPWPRGVTVTPVRDPLDFGPRADGTALERALELTYADTLDCPELCGLRSTRDVIISHMATGAFDPKRWWIVRLDGAPEGCCLLNHCPANHAIELVYLGISPKLRGRGLARRVLEHALTHADARDAREVTCAVDTRNLPATKLYHAMGFRMFGSRTGFVRPLAPAPDAPDGAGAATESPARGTLGTSGGQEKLAVAKRL